jgi:hypothetical protein
VGNTEPKTENNSVTSFQENIWSVPGGKVNILGGHSIRHSKPKKVYMYMCPIPNGFQDRAISLYSFKIVEKKEILCTVANTSIYCSVTKLVQFT